MAASVCSLRVVLESKIFRERIICFAENVQLPKCQLLVKRRVFLLLSMLIKRANPEWQHGTSQLGEESCRAVRSVPGSDVPRAHEANVLGRRRQACPVRPPAGLTKRMDSSGE